MCLLPIVGYSQVDKTIEKETKAWKISEQYLYKIDTTIHPIVNYGDKPKRFIDTIEVIVSIHHLDDLEPTNIVTTKKCFMERKGEILKSWSSDIPKDVRLSNETKVFYKQTFAKPILRKTETEGLFINEGNTFEEVEIEIPKK